MSNYLHCFDYSDKLKCLNLCSTGTLSSLLAVQLLIEDDKPNPMFVDIDNLKNCSPDTINGLSSARMLYVFKRSIYKSFTRELNKDEQRISKIGDMEIAFENGRRNYNNSAPSRLSCIYLVDNSIDGRFVLGGMFNPIFSKPRIIEVDILNRLELKRFDSSLIDLYINDPKEEYIEKYWSGQSYIKESPKWEYLLEGTIEITNQNERFDLCSYVEKNYPSDYDSIVRANGNEWWRSGGGFDE